ncbi:flagellar biosynthesis protein FlhF [Verticiella sediminum]|uniref:Flagellar biosynthesis protein FlhF n=1 Tax=Verticiella sediminum TaxID=1247510 RepID=A0A556ARX3_9BURK|nr:flagellar biosynthesis protein FlhF [Verticiella sediminum]TSH95689.1 flagellar biosynthesis protein FlhF [Verticiella sediminum]
MSVLRFFGATSRDAMRQVRERLGDDAMILANRAVEGGIEILAVSETAVTGMATQAEPAQHSPHAQHPQQAQPLRRAQAATPPPAKARELRAAPAVLAGRGAAAYSQVSALADEGLAREVDDAVPARVEMPTAGSAGDPAHAVDTPFTAPPGAPPLARAIPDGSTAAGAPAQACAAEARPGATATAAFAAPAARHVFRHLLGAGFSSPLARALAARVPAELDEAGGVAWARSELAARLPVAGDEQAWLAAGGVFALIGPTGVGKTTSTAKLAARCVLVHGRDAVAMLTTDGYRIGAHEQLRIYGRILGVPTLAVNDAQSLRQALHELRDKRVVLIDTVGMSQRDLKLAEQAALLCGAGRPVRRLLLLNAASHGDTLDEVAHAYRRGADAELTGCILTKLDESRKPGSALDVVLRHRLPIHYVSDGQRVPENFGPAQASVLVARAFDAAAEALFCPSPADWQALAPVLPPPIPMAEGAVPAITGPVDAGIAAHDLAQRRAAGLRGLEAVLGSAPEERNPGLRDAALRELQTERGVALARELWRMAWHDDAPAEALSDLALGDLAAHAPDLCERQLLALHGRLSAPRASPGGRTVATTLLCSDRGDWLAAPAVHLLTAQGVLAAHAGEGEVAHASAGVHATRERAAWLQRRLAHRTLHVFEGMTAEHLEHLEALELSWLAGCTALQPLEHDGVRSNATGIAAGLGHRPAGRIVGTGLTRWVSSAPAVLRGQRGRRHAVHLLAVRHVDDAGECRWRGFALAPAQTGDAQELALCLEAAHAGREAGAWAASGVQMALDQAETAAGAWCRHMLAGAQLGLAAARLSRRPGAAGRWLALADDAPSGRASAARRRARIEQLTRAFGALALLDAATL